MAHKNPDYDDPYEALSLLQEEAAEVIQAISKIRRSGHDFCRYNGDKTNTQYAQEEIWDFLIILKFTGFKTTIPIDYIEKKFDKLREFSNLLD